MSTVREDAEAAEAEAEAEATRLEELGVSDEAEAGDTGPEGEAEEDGGPDEPEGKAKAAGNTSVEALAGNSSETVVASGPAIRSPLKAWTEVTGSYRRKMAKMYPGPARMSAVDKGIRHALEALQSLGLEPETVHEDDAHAVEVELKTKLKAVALFTAVKHAHGLLDEALGRGVAEKDIVPKPQMNKPKPKQPAAVAVTQPTEEEEADMATEGEPELEQEQEQGESYEQEQEQPAPPPKSHKRGAARMQPVMMPGMVMTPQGPMYPAGYVPQVPGYPPQAGRPHAYPQARQAPVSPISKLLGVKGTTATTSVNIYKKTPAGERVFIRNYALSELDGSVPKFIREFVDPEEAEPNAQGFTTYEVVEVDARNVERGGAGVVKISSRSTGANGGVPDPLGQAREALDFVDDLRDKEEARRAGQTGFLQEAKAGAAKNNDFTTMLMLMMMEKLGGGGSGSNSDAVLKVLEQIRARDAGPGGLMGPSIPYVPPPAQPSFMEKFMDVQLAKMMEPPPPPKTFVDSLKELEMLKTVTGGGQNDAMKAVLDRLDRMEAKVTPVAPNGLDAQLLGFEKLTNVVKVLAPQMNLGGFVGMAQSLFTPKLLSVVGDVIGDVLTKAKSGAVKAAPAVVPKPAQPALTNGAATPAPAQPAQPRAQVPQPALDAANKLRIAQTDGVKIDALLEGLLALWDDAAYKPKLNPALKQLVEGDTLPAETFIREWYEFARGEPCPASLSAKAVKALQHQLEHLPEEVKATVMAQLGIKVPVKLEVVKDEAVVQAAPAPAPAAPPTASAAAAAAPELPIVPGTPEAAGAEPVEVVKFPQGKVVNGEVPYMGGVPASGPMSNVVQFVEPSAKV